jgi:putative MATE family efflux protein
LDSYGGFGFGLGIAGAAMATVISQVVVFLVFIFMLFFKDHSYISFNLNDFKFSTDILWDIIKIGLPASLSMIVMAVGQGVFNKILAHISVETVAAYQVAGRLDMLVFLPIFSIAASLTTLVGMFYGAKEYEALRFTIRYGIVSALIITIFSSAMVYIFADQVVRFFTEDESIVIIAVNFLQIFAFAYPFIAVGITTGRVLQGLGKGLPVLIITIVRVLGISAPLSLFFIFIMGKSVEWVWYSMSISTVVAFVIGLTWLFSTIKKLPVKNEL